MSFPQKNNNNNINSNNNNNNTNYHSSSYYPYPEPKNTYRLNPLVLGSLKNLDVDDVQEIFSKGIYDEKIFGNYYIMIFIFH